MIDCELSISTARYSHRIAFSSLNMSEEAPQTTGAPPSKSTEASVPSGTEPEAGQKHPLEHKWTLWFDNPKGSTRGQTWGQTLRAVYSFDTVEDFWWCVAGACSRPGGVAFYPLLF